MCKIASERSVFFAASGHYHYHTAHYEWDLYKLAARAIKSGGNSVKGSARAFAVQASAPLSRELERDRKDSPQNYQHVTKRGPEVLQIVFFGMEEGKPAFSGVYFSIDDDTRPTIKVRARVEHCPGDACKDGLGGPMLGEYDAVTRLLQSRSVTLFWAYDEDTVRKGIEAEIADKPDSVGPPIEIISIDAKGVHWVDKGCSGGVCLCPTMSPLFFNNGAGE